MRYEKKLKYKHIFLFLAIILAAAYGCPIYRWFSVQCPLCGTTRAWICFLRGDIAKALRYNPLFGITPFWFFAVVHYDSIFKRNRKLQFCLIIITGLIVTVYLMRIIF